MSVYRDTFATVTFAHPFPGDLTATVYRDGDLLFTSQPIAPVAGKFSLPLTYDHTQYDGKLKIVWSGTDFTRTQTVEVVTPLASIPEIRTLNDKESMSDEQCADIESAARAIIQSYTGQTFGYSYGAQTYVGNGSGKLILKQRIAELDGILGGDGFAPADLAVTTYDSGANPVVTYPNTKGELNLQFAAPIQDGWSVLIKWPQFLTNKQAPPEELVQFETGSDGVIRVPRRYWERKDRGTQYILTGAWGYDAVPDDIHEAAMLLANDYLAGDSEYRDRYLEILKIQQDSFTYHPGAFRGTGNARVDLLLGPYRRQNGMIIL